eukprot:6599675-Prymnesium_polylepis.2
MSSHSVNNCLKVINNDVTGEAAQELANVVLAHGSLTDFNGIPLAALRANSLTELGLSGKGIGLPGD